MLDFRNWIFINPFNQITYKLKVFFFTKTTLKKKNNQDAQIVQIYKINGNNIGSK